MKYQETSIEKTELDYALRNKRATEKFEALLRQHHPELETGFSPETSSEPEPTPEYKELWFKIDEPKIVVRPEPFEPAVPLIDEIKRAVCDHFGLSHTEIISERRSLKTLRPRQIAMYLSKRYTTRSLPEIGRRFGNRDHTTVLSAIRRIEKICHTDVLIAHDVAHLEARFS